MDLEEKRRGLKESTKIICLCEENQAPGKEMGSSRWHSGDTEIKDLILGSCDSTSPCSSALGQAGELCFFIQDLVRGWNILIKDVL